MRTTALALVALLYLPALHAEASSHVVASFQGKEAKVYRISSSRPMFIEWSARKSGGCGIDPYFSLWVKDGGTYAQLVANDIGRAHGSSEVIPPGSYFVQTNVICAWYQFQVYEIWQPDQPSADSANVRTWTAADGRTVEAEFLSATKTHVKFRRMADAEVFEYELAKLSKEDRDWVAEKCR